MAPVTSKHQNRLTDADDSMAVFSSWAGVSGKDRRKKVGQKAQGLESSLIDSTGQSAALFC